MNNYGQRQQEVMASTTNRMCQHQWSLEDAAAPMSRGRCRVCGEERTFLKNPDAGLPE